MLGPPEKEVLMQREQPRTEETDSWACIETWIFPYYSVQSVNKSLLLIQAVRGGFLSQGIEKSGVILSPVLQREDPKLKKATPRKMVIGK